MILVDFATQVYRDPQSIPSIGSVPGDLSSTSYLPIVWRSCCGFEASLCIRCSAKEHLQWQPLSKCLRKNANHADLFARSLSESELDAMAGQVGGEVRGHNFGMRARFLRLLKSERDGRSHMATEQESRNPT